MQDRSVTKSDVNTDRTPWGRRSAAVAVGLIMVLVGCGSDEPEALATESDDGTAQEASDSTIAEAAAADEAEAGNGEKSGMLTTDDGTVYVFDVNSCDTSNNNPSALPLDNGWDLSGRTADGEFYFLFIRAGLDAETAVLSGTLEGDFDDEGKNAQMLYTVQEEGLDVTVDGNNVSGSFTLRAVGPPTRPHGDETGATIDFRC